MHKTYTLLSNGTHGKLIEQDCVDLSQTSEEFSSEELNELDLQIGELIEDFKALLPNRRKIHAEAKAIKDGINNGSIHPFGIPLGGSHAPESDNLMGFAANLSRMAGGQIG